MDARISNIKLHVCNVRKNVSSLRHVMSDVVYFMHTAFVQLENPVRKNAASKMLMANYLLLFEEIKVK